MPQLLRILAVSARTYVGQDKKINEHGRMKELFVVLEDGRRKKRKNRERNPAGNKKTRKNYRRLNKIFKYGSMMAQQGLWSLMERKIREGRTNEFVMKCWSFRP